MDLNDASLLTPDSDGVIWLTLKIGPAQSQENAPQQLWTLNGVYLEITNATALGAGPSATRQNTESPTP